MKWLLPFATLVVVLTACSASATVSSSAPLSGAPAPGALGTRTSEGGGVTVAVQWDGPGVGAAFQVALDTHSVDLDGLTLGEAVLRNDRDEALSNPTWEAPKGGHHRAGLLRFEAPKASFFDGAKWIELVIYGVGDLPERTLRWQLGARS